MEQNIYLIGFMGVGKSTVSQALAQITGYEELDADEEISRGQGMSIPEIFERYGEPYFREQETRFLERMQGREHFIISCGGGMALRKENVALMHRSGVVVELTAKPETVLERVKDSRERPVLNGHMNKEEISALMEARSGYYRQARALDIPTDERTPGEVAEEIKKNLKCGKFSFDFLKEV